jgi:hypothetical protein
MLEYGLHGIRNEKGESAEGAVIQRGLKQEKNKNEANKEEGIDNEKSAKKNEEVLMNYYARPEMPLHQSMRNKNAIRYFKHLIMDNEEETKFMEMERGSKDDDNGKDELTLRDGGFTSPDEYSCSDRNGNEKEKVFFFSIFVLLYLRNFFDHFLLYFFE